MGRECVFERKSESVCVFARECVGERADADDLVSTVSVGRPFSHRWAYGFIGSGFIQDFLYSSRALPTGTKVDSGASQIKSGTSVN